MSSLENKSNDITDGGENDWRKLDNPPPKRRWWKPGSKRKPAPQSHLQNTPGSTPQDRANPPASYSGAVDSISQPAKGSTELTLVNKDAISDVQKGPRSRQSTTSEPLTPGNVASPTSSPQRKPGSKPLDDSKQHSTRLYEEAAGKSRPSLQIDSPKPLPKTPCQGEDLSAVSLQSTVQEKASVDPSNDVVPPAVTPKHGMEIQSTSIRDTQGEKVNDAESINDLFAPDQSIKQAELRIPPLPEFDLNSEKWLVEIKRLQRAEERLTSEKERLKSQLSKSFEEQHKLREEVKAKDNQLEERLDQLETLEFQLKLDKETEEKFVNEVRSLKLQNQTRGHIIQTLKDEKIKLQGEINDAWEKVEIIRGEREFHRKEVERLEAEKRNIERNYNRERVESKQKNIEREEAQKANIGELKAANETLEQIYAVEVERLNGELRTVTFEKQRLEELSKDQELQCIAHSIKLQQITSETERLKTEIGSLHQTKKSLTEQRNLSQRQVEQLESRITALKETTGDKTRLLTTQNRTLNDQQNRSKDEIVKLQISITNLTNAKSQAQNTIESLTREKKTLNEQYYSTEQKVIDLGRAVQGLEDKKAEADFKIESLNELLRKLEKDKSYHEDDARRLRADISQAGNQQSPRRDEDYYIRSFGALEADIQGWIAKNAKANAAQALSSQQENHLMQGLGELGQQGQRVSEYLRSHNRLKTWYATPSYRIQLVRHIVATFLFASVFYPFVVGLPNTSSEMLSWIDNDIMESREGHFGQFLSIRQSVGTAAVRYVQQFCGEQLEDLKKCLVKLLSVLLPRAAERDITKGVSRFLNKAIKLKHEMAEEQALYHCYWVNGGDRYEEELVEIEGEEQGSISICTFPGLGRTVKNADGDFTARPVKARALLQGTFLF